MKAIAATRTTACESTSAREAPPKQMTTARNRQRSTKFMRLRASLCTMVGIISRPFLRSFVAPHLLPPPGRRSIAAFDRAFKPKRLFPSPDYAERDDAMDHCAGLQKRLVYQIGRASCRE